MTFVWYTGSQIADATVTGNTLSSATAVASGPTNGELLDAVVAPDHSIWTIAYDGTSKRSAA